MNVGPRLKLLRHYARRRVRRELDGIYTRGLKEARALVAQHPLIICSNHVSWWDPFVLLLSAEALNMRGRCLMDHKALSNLGFFRWLGAIPIHMNNPRLALKELSDAGQRARPSDPIWIFPSGEYKRPHVEDLQFRSGLVRLCKSAPKNALVLPVALDVAFIEAKVPRYFVGFEAPMPLDECIRRKGEARVQARIDSALKTLWRSDELMPLLASRKNRELNGLGSKTLKLIAREEHNADDKKERS